MILKAISIHALREEGDLSRACFRQSAELISIHALREEGDVAFFACTLPHSRFLSTPSARRATRYEVNGKLPDFISIHALREEGDGASGRAARIASPISIHALREEGDV